MHKSTVLLCLNQLNDFINENQKSKIENCKNKVIGFEDKINFYFSLNLGQYLLSIPYLI